MKRIDLNSFQAILIVLVALCLSVESERCRFARHYTTQDILRDPEPFLQEVIEWETKFMKQVGLQNETGLTYDGYRLDINTG